MQLVLGSASARRLELLGLLGVTPCRVTPPDIDETPKRGETPLEYVRRMALEKAGCFEPAAGEIVLCADTIVAVGQRILGKPADAVVAQAYLSLLSGRRHRVITALVVKTETRTWRADALTAVRFKRLSVQEMTDYIATNEWQGKAGGYAIQGCAGAFIPAINGSYSNVMGLPMDKTAGLLRSAGYKFAPKAAL